MAQSVFRSGNLEAFDKRLELYKREKASFVVRSGGLSRRVKLEGSAKTFRFFGHPNSSFVDGSFFAPMVKKSIDAFIEKHGELQTFDKPDIQQFNVARVESNLYKPVAAVDLNNCHWTTAYLLGFIPETLFKRGIASGKKKGLLVSIGSLNKLEQLDYYENGRLVRTEFDHAQHARYSPFYWAIIGRVRDVMMETYSRHQDNFYMWLTDCAFVDAYAANQLRRDFEAMGYKSKQYMVDFVQVSTNKVFWYEAKTDTKKSIAYQHREIDVSYALWQGGAENREGRFRDPLTLNKDNALGT
jgi:hypothetical protein